MTKPDESEISAAIEAVLRFASAWTAWERNMAKRKDSLHDPEMKAAHRALIQEHCTAKERKYVDGLTTYCTPPTYEGVVRENVVHAELQSGSRAHVDVNCRGGLTPYRRFVVLKQHGVWRIDSVKTKASEQSPWRNGLIGL